MELPIIGFSIAICHYYDAEVGGPLEGPLKDKFKKGRFYVIKTGPPKKVQTASVLSQSSRLVSVQNKTSEGPATSPCSLRSAQRRRATELRPHRLACRSVAFTTK